MKAKFSVIHLLMLVGVLIGCSEPDHDVFNDVLSPSQLPSHESNPNLRPTVSVDTVAQPLPLELPLEQEEVAAAPPLLLLVVPIVSCGAAVLDLGTLAFGTPEFLSKGMFFVGALGLACPDGGILKGVKGIRILKSANTLKKLKFQRFTAGNYADNFKEFIGRNVWRGYEIHHAIPQHFRKQAAKLGVNIDQPWHLVEVRRGYHRRFSSKYTRDWAKFFRQPGLTRSKLLDYEQHMLKQYHLKPGSYLEVVK